MEVSFPLPHYHTGPLPLQCSPKASIYPGDGSFRAQEEGLYVVTPKVCIKGSTKTKNTSQLEEDHVGVCQVQGGSVPPALQLSTSPATISTTQEDYAKYGAFSLRARIMTEKSCSSFSFLIWCSALFKILGLIFYK